VGDNASPEFQLFRADGRRVTVRWHAEGAPLESEEIEAWKERQRGASWTQQRLPELERGWAKMDYPTHKAFYGRVAAGAPIEAIEVPDTIAVPEELVRSNNTYVLQVNGDSMVEEGILDGDFIVVEDRKTATNGETAVVIIEGAATVKKFYRERGRVRLEPANAALSPIFVRDRDLEIRGVVVAVMRKYHRR